MFGGGENAPPLTEKERKQNEMKANAQFICAVQPNADGHSLTVEIQKGPIGGAKVLAAGGLEIKAYPGQTPAESFKAGTYFAEGDVANPKTGAQAGKVAIAGNNLGTDYSCIFKFAAEGAFPQSGQVLNQPVAKPILPDGPKR